MKIKAFFTMVIKVGSQHLSSNFNLNPGQKSPDLVKPKTDSEPVQLFALLVLKSVKRQVSMFFLGFFKQGVIYIKTWYHKRNYKRNHFTR